MRPDSFSLSLYMYIYIYGRVRYDFACNPAGKSHFSTVAGPAGKSFIGGWLGQGACRRDSFWLAVDTAGFLARASPWPWPGIN